MVNRAWLYLRRKYKRSILLLLLLFVISCSISIGICVWNSISDVTTEIQQTLGTSFIIRLPSYVQSPDYSGTIDVETEDGNTVKAYNGPKLNQDVVDSVMQVEGIATYNAEKKGGIHADDFGLISGLFGNNLDSENPNLEMTRVYASVADIVGYTDTSLSDKFRTGSFTLTEGSHMIAEDQNKCLISEELAKHNNLQVGDTLTVSLRVGMMGNYSDPMRLIGEPRTWEITGIFHVNGYQPTGIWVAEYESAYNLIVCNVDTAMELREDQDKFSYQDYVPELMYDNVTFFVDDPAQLEAVVEEVKNLDTIDTDFFDITLDDTMYESTVTPLKTIRNWVAGAAAVIVIGCIIVLCIVFTMWVRSRKKEIAVYLSMGFGKASIIGQFIVEAAMIALVAGVISFVACQKVPDMIDNQLLVSVVENAQPEEKEYTQEEISQAATTGTTSELFSYESSDYAGPDHIDFTFHVTDFLLVLLLEIIVIVAAICKGSSFIFELQPKQIMSDLR